MFEQFDEYTKQIEDEKNKWKDAPAQWELLKHFVSQLADGERGFDDHPFRWTADENGTAILRLHEVAAQFIDESKRNVARKGYRIRFGQPQTAHGAFSEAPLEPEEWKLEPGTLEGEFIWLIDGKRHLPEQLAQDIAFKVTECHQEFEQRSRLDGDFEPS